ncbi:MAG: LysR family transcriptional regulator [Rhizobiales bacterium]|nr:LysR family transcriptional regulator [Hyphomicrobiales bacterium]
MKLQQLRFFTAVYEEGSFSAGAARVNATQSGLSMQVRELEERFGVTLLTRSSTGVQPTEAGRRFYAQAVKVLRASTEAEEVLKRAAGAVSGHVRVGLMPTFTRAVLAPALLRFTRAHELVRLSVLEAYSSHLCAEVAKGAIDFAVVPAIDGMLQVQATPMGTDREYLVSSPDHGPTHLQPVRLRDLAPLRLVLPSRANARRVRIDAYIAANGIEVEEILELDAMLGTLDLVASSDWMTILPGILCAPDVLGQERILNPIEGPVLTVDYALIEPNAQTLSQAARTFAKILQEELDRTLIWNPAAAI